MTKQKSVLVAVFATIMWLSMILPMQLQVQAEDDGELSDDSGGGDDSSDQSGDSGDSSDSGNNNDEGGTTEDDGYTYNSDDPDEQQKQDEEEHQAREDAGRPGDTSNKDDNNEESAQVIPPIQAVQPKCKLGVIQDCVLNDLGQTCTFPTDVDACQDAVGGATGTPERDANGQLINKPSALPYCDKPHSGSCWDRQDYDMKTGLYPCNDGTQKVHWKFCKDATKNDNNNGGSSSSQPQQTATTDCDTWSYNLDMKLAAQNATVDLLNADADRLNTMYDKAITPAQIDSYNAQVDAQNAKIDANEVKSVQLDAEVAKWNVECAT
jgi:hypothetical protein